MMSPALTFQSFELDSLIPSTQSHNMARTSDWENDHSSANITLSRVLTALENQVQDEKNLQSTYQRNKLSAVRSPRRAFMDA